MPGAFFSSRNKEATEVYFLGLTKTVLTSSLTEPGDPWNPFFPSVTLGQRRLEKHRGPDGRATHASKTK